jgi:hypothetical protein
MMAATSSIAGKSLALTLAALVALTGPSSAQVMPSAPQTPSAQDGTDGPGFIRVPSSLKGGTGGFVDITGYASCRFVTTTAGGDATKNGEVIPVATLAGWQAFLGRSNPDGDTQVVCCRPKAIQMCQVGGAVPQTVTLPYTILGQQQQPVMECTDQWGDPYKDTQTWVCDETGSGVTADGQWAEQGTDAYQCAPSAYTTGCTVSCGGGTQTTYDSCGNVQAVTACSTQACCTPSYSKSCNTTTAIYTDTTCGTGSYSVSGGCSAYSCQVGGASCDAGSRQTIIGTCPECNIYYDCGSSWSSWGDTSGTAQDVGWDCETDYVDGLPVTAGGSCPPGAGVDNIIYMGTCYD